MSRLDVRSISTDQLAETPAPRVAQDFRVFLDESIFDGVVARGNEESDREVGGVLVGELRRDADGPYIVVEATIDALHADEKETELTFTHETWAHIHEEMDSRYVDKTILGWWHTHPGFGVFLSDRDQFIQQSFFNAPHQIAFVYDPNSREHGVFVWSEGTAVRARSYWIGARETIWSGAGSRAARLAEKDAGDGPPVAAPVRAPSTTPSDSVVATPSSLLTGAIALLLLGGVLGWMFAPRSVVAPAADPAKNAAGVESIRAINGDLLSLMRAFVDEGTTQELTGLVRELGESLAALEAGKEGAQDKVDAAVTALAVHAARIGEIDKRMRILERIVHATSVDPDENRRLIATQGSVLGEACLELARRAAADGDKARARVLYSLAARVDPARRKQYEKLAGQLEDGEDG